jgi:hypothetical protein
MAARFLALDACPRRSQILVVTIRAPLAAHLPRCRIFHLPARAREGIWRIGGGGFRIPLALRLPTSVGACRDPVQENQMIDVNKLLTAVMTGGEQGRAGSVPQVGGRGGLPQAPGGGGGIG